jgi:hydrogenase nickel incorporation protein HypA/HybF
MHELSITGALLDAVRVEADARPGMRVREVGVLLGELAGVDGSALSFCFDALVAGTPLAGAALHIEICPRLHRCRACTEEFVVVDYRTACPACDSPDTVCIGGEELRIAYLELEET